MKKKQSLRVKTFKQQFNSFPKKHVLKETRSHNLSEVYTYAQRRKVIRLLIAIVISFALSVLPLHISLLWQTFSKDPGILSHALILGPISYLIFYSNSALNPILYAFLSENFRKSMYEIFRGTHNQRANIGRRSTLTSFKTRQSLI